MYQEYCSTSWVSRRVEARAPGTSDGCPEPEQEGSRRVEARVPGKRLLPSGDIVPPYPNMVYPSHLSTV